MENPSRQPRTVRRNDLLDMWRFVAAMVVVFYHYALIGPAINRTGEADFSAIVPIAKFGYLGVSFFFMISGYVIFQSAQNGGASRFIASRISRLFPAYWLAVFISLYALVLFPHADLSLPIETIAINLTMLQGFLGVPHVDNVFWTLTVELLFYGLILSLLWMRALDRLQWIAVFLLSIATIHHTIGVPGPVYVLAQPEWAPYFMAGCAFYWLQQDTRPKRLASAILLWSLVLCLTQAWEHAHKISDYTQQDISAKNAVLLTALLFPIFALSISKDRSWQIPGATVLGAISYPLYLLHQNVGYTALAHLATESNSYVIGGGLLVILIVVSFAVSKWIETPMRRPLHRLSTRLYESISFPLTRNHDPVAVAERRTT